MAGGIAERVINYAGVNDAEDIADSIDVMADQCRTFGGLSPERFPSLRVNLARWHFI